MTKETTKSNVVKLSNGEVLDFRNNSVFSSYDLAEGTITFKVVSGEVLTLNIADLTEEVKTEAVIYGVREKIKATLAPYRGSITENEAKEGKLNKAGKIAQEIESLKAGNFVTRTQEAGNVGLDNFLKAFAIVNATGAIRINNEGAVVPVPAKARLLPELKAEWANIQDPKVVQDVLAYWNVLDKDVKSAQKRNNSIKFQADLIDSGAVTV